MTATDLISTFGPADDAATRSADALLATMPLREKIGLLFHAPVVAGAIDEPNQFFSLPSIRELIEERRITHFNVVGTTPTAGEFAEWHNEVQRIAVRAEIPVPVTFSTDPRHAFSDNPATAAMAGPFSQWPEPLGLGAIGSEERAFEFADTMRREYLAVGIRVALHPQIDLATEPRWARANHTFGEDVTLVSKLGAAYVRGLQGPVMGPESVAAMIKHFPGGGPQRDGEDPHFPYGREQIYPGGMFEHHLRPFQEALDAGASQVMPYYGMPVGTEHEEVGFGFNRSVITGLLRQRLGFDGIVCSDWGLITDMDVMGVPMPARAWGVEQLDRASRLLKIIDAGVDQIGGEVCTDLLLELVDRGRVSESRVDESARRILREKYRMGLFADPFVDAGAADAIVGARPAMYAGHQAQSEAMTVIANPGLLPLRPGYRVYTEGIAPAAVTEYAEVVASPEEADVAILRIHAPFEQRTEGVEAYFHAGSLDFPEEEIARIRRLCETVPTVVQVYLDRPAILTPILPVAAAVVADFGADDAAAAAVLFGHREPRGRLPFDLPRSMDAVRASRPDVPFDTINPLFRFGHAAELRASSDADKR
ncbi:glycoside hydrolase family 3 protein [Leifsonia sp. AG29]|uniref:glycoside hydrolase family 3 protein n=1 Tax=Leifsonia sp. AG29 TaxID=2598860 RepID=UPI00131CD5A9|nr:glycoside hydrolase family 3 N-terminal domain-containing protein [Leifsonia sp. AG29]